MPEVINWIILDWIFAKLFLKVVSAIQKKTQTFILKSEIGTDSLQ